MIFDPDSMERAVFAPGPVDSFFYLESRFAVKQFLLQQRTMENLHSTVLH